MLVAAQLPQWSGPLARVRSLRPLTADVRRLRGVRHESLSRDVDSSSAIGRLK